MTDVVVTRVDGRRTEEGLKVWWPAPGGADLGTNITAKITASQL